MACGTACTLVGIVLAISLAPLLPAGAAENGTAVPTFSPSSTYTYYPTVDYYDPSRSDAYESTYTQYDAVIVGAGWAGIRAAKTLLDEGISSILVLEANDYVGGRSKTVNADGSVNVPNPSNVSHAPIDLGSEWLYIDSNDMEDELRDTGLIEGIDLDDIAHFLAIDDSLFYLQSKAVEGEDFIDGAVSTRLLDETETRLLHGRVWDRFLAFRDELLENGRDQSYLSAVQKFVKRKNLNDPTDVQYLNLLLDLGEIDQVGESDELSLAQYVWLTGELDEKRYMSVPGVGYGNVAATYAAPFSSKIKLGAKVTEIDHSQPDIVVSFAENGVPQQITTKTVLVTASLGVLKAGSIQFTPPLPEWKQEAIDRTGFGVMNKCAMQWNDNDAAVWPDDEWLGLITPEDESSGKWTTVFNPTKRKGIPTLVAWIGGQDARDMETQPDDEVLEDVMKNLRAMFPNITEPDRVIVTRWGQEENILGTYSFCKVSQDFSLDSSLLKRRDGNVFFAGEHTAGSTWFGTTVGAWETGEEAASLMRAEIAKFPDGARAQSSVPSSEPSSPPSPPPASATANASSTAEFHAATSLSLGIVLGSLIMSMA